MSETNQCDGCQRGLPVDTQGTHYDPAEAGVDAWSRYRIGCTRQRYAEPDPRDAEIARLREDLARAEAMNRINVCGYCHAQFQRTEDGVRQLAKHILCCERSPLAVALHRVAGERDEARAQLAAAQADAVALRGALDLIHVQLEPAYELATTEEAAQPIYFAMRDAQAALATPAPGAPLLDAVRELVEASAGVLRIADRNTDEFSAFRDALAAVRAVLSCAQDTAGISRGGGG